MGIMVYSLLGVMQDFVHQPYDILIYFRKGRIRRVQVGLRVYRDLK